MNQKKTYTLHPDWKDKFGRYLLGYALVPVFGLGLLIIRNVRKQQRETKYVISDDSITFYEPEENVSVNLVNIEQINVSQTNLERKFSIGRIQLEANGKNYELQGIENPVRIEEILRAAIATEKDRQRQKAKVKGSFPDLNAGSVDKVNTLVGLWQQGLIDDEEYERERKKI